jgi:crossover junction endodeoxyribonuclease RuvC
VIVAIDPGLTGAFALTTMTTGELVDIVDMPRVGQELDAAEIVTLLHRNAVHVVMERQAYFPAPNGGKGWFGIGKHYGVLLGILATLAIPYDLVRPTEWCKAMGVVGGDKDGHRLRAMQLYPASAALFRRKLDHGRADAALIAHHHHHHNHHNKEK